MRESLSRGSDQVCVLSRLYTQEGGKKLEIYVQVVEELY